MPRDSYNFCKNSCICMLKANKKVEEVRRDLILLTRFLHIIIATINFKSVAALKVFSILRQQFQPSLSFCLQLIY